MAKCDQGYMCEVCGDEVEDITGSDLYLRYVLGEVEARHLMTAPERHLRCNPVTSQFIVTPEFEPVVVEGPFDKRSRRCCNTRATRHASLAAPASGPTTWAADQRLPTVARGRSGSVTHAPPGLPRSITVFALLAHSPVSVV